MRDPIPERPQDLVNEKMYAGETQTIAAPQNLLGCLHNRRRQLERELRKVQNSIDFCEKNAALVEVVEIVLASREKCEPRPF